MNLGNLMKICKMRGSILETIIGFIVILVAALSVYHVVNRGYLKANGDEYYHVKANFDRVDGIQVGSEVRIAGIPIGSVTDISLDSSSFIAKTTLSIKKGVNMPADTSAQIVTNGLLGSKFIELTPGAEEDVLTDNSFIEITQSSINLERLISKFMFKGESSSNNAS